MVKKSACFVLTAVICAHALTALAVVSLPRLFSDNMVVQRDKPVHVWGAASAGETVTVALGGNAVKATADAAGAWRVALPPQAHASGLTLTVSGENTHTFTNVAVGDVWLCSGQSNMEWGLGSCNAPDDVASADFPLIRVLRVPKTASPALCAALPEATGSWTVCSPKTAAGFTAVGFYFAREIHPQAGVPIGLIDTSWGGSRIEPYLAPEGFALVPEAAPVREAFDQEMDKYRKALVPHLDALERWAADTRAALAAEKPLPTMPTLPANPAADNQRLYAKYNAMVAPLVAYPVRGVLWYQGCSNGGEGEPYVHKTAALVKGWRQLWGDPDLPFYVVQLANFTQDKKEPVGGDGYAHLRMAQLQAFRLLPHTGLAVTIDIGETNDIHPKNKYDVGLRLSKWALLNEYGKAGTIPSGPLFKGMKAEGGSVRLQFDFVGGGLMVGKKIGRDPVAPDPEGALARFAIAGDDQKWYWATAEIEGETVIVSSPQVLQPVAVRYAFSANPLGANLYNKEGFPASPFRTDNW